MKKTTIIPMVIFAGIVVAIVVSESKKGPQNGDHGHAHADVFPFSQVEVSRIDWKRGAQEYSVEKRGEKWWVVKPIEMPAQTIEIESFLGVVAPHVHAEPLPKGTTPAPQVTGLDAPAYEIVLHGRENRRARLVVGKPVAENDRFYVRLGDSPDILLLHEFVVGALDQSLEQLRDRGLWRFAPDDLLSVSTTSAGATTAIRRAGPTWVLEGAKPDLADPREVDSWGAQFSSTETLGYEKKGPQSHGFDAPFAVFDLAVRDRAIRITVGAPTEEGGKRRWIENSVFPGEVATLQEDQVRALLLLPDRLLSKKAFPVPFETCSRYAATRGDMTVEAEGGGDVWTIKRPSVLTNPFPGRVGELLRELARADLEKRLDPAPAPADAVAVEFGWPDGASFKASVWTDGTGTLVLSADPARLVRINDASCWEHIAAGEAFLRNPLVVDVLPMQMQRLAWEREGKPVADMRFDGRNWSLETPVPGKALDPERASFLNRVFCELVADTWLREKASKPEFGLDRPVWRIRMIPDPEKKADAKETVILIGAVGPRGMRYGQVEGSDAVFVVPGNVTSALETGVWKQ